MGCWFEISKKISETLKAWGGKVAKPMFGRLRPQLAVHAIEMELRSGHEVVIGLVVHRVIFL